MPTSDDHDYFSRISLLERTLNEIIALAEKHPDNVPVQRARILAEASLRAPNEPR
jgi:hypothetical protein